MKATQLREKTADELREAYDEKRQELFKLQVHKDDSGEDAENPLRARILRRDLARIKTVMTEVEREGVENNG